MKTIKNLCMIAPVFTAIFLLAACGGSVTSKSTVQQEKPVEKKYAVANTEGNLIKNGTFNGLTDIKKIAGYEVVGLSLLEKIDQIGYWHVLCGANGNGKADVINGGCKITIFAPGTEVYGVQLSQLPLMMEKGKNYKVSFDACADEPRSIVVRIGIVGNGWAPYSGDQKINITAEMKNYSFTFTMNHPTDEKARLDFNVGLSTASVTINNVVVMKVD